MPLFTPFGGTIQCIIHRSATSGECRRFDNELSAMGMLPNAKVLPPHIVKFITEKFAIDVE